MLRLDDDKYVMLGEQGAMKVRAEGSAESGRTAIHLENGSVLSEIQNPLSQDSSYEIITPSATMSVRGTVFEVRKAAEGGSYEVLVYEGTVAVGLGDLEPVLYTGGEYTQFTAGDAPQFLVERDVITENRMDDQMLERLQQIEENGRALEFGEVQLDELIEGRRSSGGRTEVADNSQVKEPAASAEAPGPTASAVPMPTKAPTVSPTVSPESTASPKPTATRTPSATATPSATTAPEVTVTPSVTPDPEHHPGPSLTPGPAFPPIPEETVKPAHTPDPTKEPASTEPPAGTSEQEWWSRADGQGNMSEMGENGWKVVYFQPDIADILLDGDKVTAVIGNQVPSGFRRETIKGTELLQEYKNQPTSQSVKISTIKEGKVTDEQSIHLKFVGWFYENEDGNWTEWDYNKSPESDLWLYSVWKDDVNNKCYYPKIWRDPDTKFYRCYSVREDSIEFIDKQTNKPLP